MGRARPSTGEKRGGLHGRGRTMLEYKLCMCVRSLGHEIRVGQKIAPVTCEDAGPHQRFGANELRHLILALWKFEG